MPADITPIDTHATEYAYAAHLRAIDTSTMAEIIIDAIAGTFHAVI